MSETKRMKLSALQKDEKSEDKQQTCAHWVIRKKRFCKMTVAKGRNYCGEHEPPTKMEDEKDTVNGAERIPCPLDGKHTVYKKNLHKHLKICNAKPKDIEPPYIVRGINAGDSQEETQSYSDLKLNDLSDEEFYGVIDIVKKLYGECVKGQIETLQMRHNLLNDELAKSEYGKETRKHLEQASALLGILDNEHLFQNFTSFIEFGAGKGQLAFYLAQLIKDSDNSQVVLIDRMSLRHKKDNKIEDRSLVHRIRADIADFCMEKLELLNKSQHNIAVSKHLCGVATDLTLRCITQPTTQSCTFTPTEYIMIALCCHHRCEWNAFVGKEFFKGHNITHRQFVIITKMVSWAICGTGKSREKRREIDMQTLTTTKTTTTTVTAEIPEVNTMQRLSLKERERIGFMCKRVIDYARLEYLKQHGYSASLKSYVSRDVTLENVCLLARKLST